MKLIVELAPLNVMLDTLAIVQTVDELPVIVQVLVPSVTARVLALLLLNRLDETLNPFVRNPPAVSVMFPVVESASASWTVLDALMVIAAAKGTPFDVIVDVAVVEVDVKLVVPEKVTVMLGLNVIEPEKRCCVPPAHVPPNPVKSRL